MFIRILPSGPFATNAYVLGCQSTKEAVIVDPGVSSVKSILSTIKDEALLPKKILLTHSHWDHIGDVAVLQKQLNIPVYIHEKDAPNLISPGSDLLPMTTYIQGTNPDGYFDEGDEIWVGLIKFIVIHTPGHTPGSVCFYSEDEKILISGDTLFKGSIGNLSFPTSQPDLMWTSLKKLEKLPAETKVYPGHGPFTTIGKESWLPRAQDLFS